VRRVLFDENMPRKLRRDLPGFDVRTVQEEGWGGLENGHLLRRASETFDVLLTADQRMRFQQNVQQFDIAVVVVVTPDTTLPNLQRFLDAIRRSIDEATPGVVTLIDAD
jgi:hypothetical protein